MKRLHIGSIVIGILTCIFFVSIWLKISEFNKIFGDLNVPLPGITEFFIGISPMFPALGALSLIGIIGKDYWLKDRDKKILTIVNTLCIYLLLVLAVIITIAMFLPLMEIHENLG